MGSAQGELRACLVIEERRLPLRTVVTFNTAGHTVLGKLLSVHVLMAIFALCRRRFEIDIAQFRFQAGRLVTLDAGCDSMRSLQWKLCLRVIKARQFLP